MWAQNQTNQINLRIQIKQDLTHFYKDLNGIRVITITELATKLCANSLMDWMASGIGRLWLMVAVVF